MGSLFVSFFSEATFALFFGGSCNPNMNDVFFYCKIFLFKNLLPNMIPRTSTNR
jgi:hypothetical protein